MKRLLMTITCMLGFMSVVESQTLLKPENDSTFITEFRDDNEFGIIARDSVIVSVSCNTMKDDYGSYYQLDILIQNLTDNSFVFDPADVKAYLATKWDEYEPMTVYTAQSLQKKMRNEQMWTSVFMGISAGLNAATAGYSNSYISSPYGSYTVKTYNAGNAAMANMLATNQMLQMGKQMENDRRVRNDGYLKKNTIRPGEGICGYMLVKKLRGRGIDVIIPVNGKLFSYSWSLIKKRNQ